MTGEYNSLLEQRVAALEAVVNHLKATQPHLMPVPAVPPEPGPAPVAEPVTESVPEPAVQEPEPVYDTGPDDFIVDTGSESHYRTE